MISGGCSQPRYHGEDCGAQIECTLSGDSNLQCDKNEDDDGDSRGKCVCPGKFYYDEELKRYCRKDSFEVKFE